MKLGLAIALLVPAFIVLGCIGPSLSECEKLGKQSSKDFCYLNSSWVRNDSSFCGKIESLNERDFCYFKLLAKEPTRRLCDQISKSSTYKWDCYLYAAINSNRPDWCEPWKPEEVVQNKDYSEDSKTDCIFRVAVYNQEAKTCDGIKGEANDVVELKDLCYALSKRDLKSCEKLKSEAAKEQCYLEFAVINKDVSLCEKLSLRNNESSYYKEGKDHCTVLGLPTTRESCYCALFWWSKQAEQDLAHQKLLDLPRLAISPSAINTPATYNLGEIFAGKAVVKITQAAEEVYGSGLGSSKTIEITVPYNATCNISRNEVTFSLWRYFGITDVYEENKVNLTGCINCKISGTRNLVVESVGNGTKITDEAGCG